MKINTLLLTLAAALLVAGCAHPALREADDLARANQLPQAWMVLDKAAEQNPQDASLRTAKLRLRDQLVGRLLMQIESLRAGGRLDEARDAVQRLREVDPRHPRLAWLEAELDRAKRQDAKLAEGRTLLRQGKADAAEALARGILAESPQHPGARLLLSQSAQAKPLETAGTGGEMAPAFQKPVTLEFRDAPLRQVFESLSRSADINFVFDRDVRADARVTIFLRSVTLDEAMRVILSTQGLDRKLLNDSSVLIFPNTQAKQREHQELVTRTFYLSNADVKQTQAMVRTIAKVRDLHIDERLNLMVVRDTPEVLRLVERLIASIDLPEPEVMLEVEVMEVASDRVDALGLQWPESIQVGLSDAAGNIPDRIFIGGSNPINFRASIANPAVVATLRGTSGNVNLLANPKIRVRNRDKALVQVGQKVPVFTTTTNFTGTTSVAASVSYLDVGLKLEVEPSVQLDNDVAIKVALEVSNLIRQVTGPGGTTAYEIGSRKATTSLRLNDGETQVLAGLINDEDRRSAAGIPGLNALPLLGRLFGTQTDTRNKTEVVLLITPRIVRNLALPDAANARVPSGTDASPGAFSTTLRPQAKAGVGLAGGGVAAASARPAGAGMPAPVDASGEAVVKMDVTPQVPPGGSVSVSLRNESGFAIKGEVEYDPTRLAVPLPAGVSGSSSAPGRVPVELGPRGQRVLILRALPAANGQVLNVGFVGLSASGPNGEQPPARVDGTGLVTVDMPPR